MITKNASLAVENNRKYHAISVAANGIGFAEEYSEKFFQLFTRLHGKHEYSGTGVGMFIARKVVEKHQGMIRAQSVPGEGSVFLVYLPVSQGGRHRAKGFRGAFLKAPFLCEQTVARQQGHDAITKEAITFSSNRCCRLILKKRWQYCQFAMGNLQ